MCVNQLLRPTTYTDLMMKLYQKCATLRSVLVHDKPECSTMDYDPFKVDKIVDFYNRWQNEKQTKNKAEDVR